MSTLPFLKCQKNETNAIQIQFNFFFLILSCVIQGKAQTPQNGDQHWVINNSISDEFNYTGNHTQVITQLSNKWHFMENWGNKYADKDLKTFPISYYQGNGDDIEVNNGICEIYAKYKPNNYQWPCSNCWTATNEYHYFNYTNGCLIRNTQTRFGYYEIKIRLPYYPNEREKTNGVAPSFWFFGEMNQQGTPDYAYGEIDVFEQIDLSNAKPNVKPYVFGPTIHYSKYDNCNCHTQLERYDKIGWNTQDEVDPPLNYHVDFSDGNFHIIGFEWQKEYISIYVDGVERSSVNFKQDQLLSMNAYLDIAFFNDINKYLYTVFPFKYEVDYFRYYQLNNHSDLSLFINQSNYDNTTLGFTKRKNITIGGSYSTAKVNTGSQLILRADDFILLDEGFEVDESTYIYLQVNENQD